MHAPLKWGRCPQTPAAVAGEARPRFLALLRSRALRGTPFWFGFWVLVALCATRVVFFVFRALWFSVNRASHSLV